MRPALALCALGALAGPFGVSGQEGCVFGDGSGDFFSETIPGGGRISYVSTPHFVCDDGVEIWADSAIAYSQLGMSHLLGSVRYLDQTRELRADTARYFSEQGRLQANGNVAISDQADGSQIENGVLVYLRVTDFRDEESMTVTTGPDGIRPRAVMIPAPPDSVQPTPPDSVELTPPDSVQRTGPGEPYTVVGDRILLRGESYFAAIGDVEIERDSLLAFADSAEYDEAFDDLILVGDAQVLSGENELVGRTITVGSPSGEWTTIHARHQAMLNGPDLQLTSPRILVYLHDGALERLVATPITSLPDEPVDSLDLARPVVSLENVELVGDSIEVSAPAEVVDRVYAVGNARTTSTSQDSLNVDVLPDVARSDWLAGDTVIVSFRPKAASVVTALLGEEVPPEFEPPSDSSTTPPLPTEATGSGEGAAADGAAQTDPGAGNDYEVESIVASGQASSLYRLAPSDTVSRAGEDAPAIHYVVGSEITVTMAAGQVDAMKVVGQTQGMHLEPLTRRVVRDTMSVDTSAAALPDTSGVVGPAAARRPNGAEARRTPDGTDTNPEGSAAARREEPWTRE